MLAQILYALGRLDEVLELTALGRDESSPDDLHTQIQWRGPRAKVLARRGEAEEAERLAREGVELAEPTDFLNVRATALLDLAEVLLVDGRADEAASAVAAAAALFEQKGNVVGLARSRALSSSRDPSSPARRGRGSASRRRRRRPGGSTHGRWRRRPRGS